MFDEKFGEGIFLGYSLYSKTSRIYNKITLTIEESMHVSLDETNVRTRFGYASGLYFL